MSLTINETNHWQLPNGAELYSGDSIEFMRNGSWTPARIEYRPKKQYVLVLENGRECPISTNLAIRLHVVE